MLLLKLSYVENKISFFYRVKYGTLEKKIKAQTLIHLEAVKISCSRIIEEKDLKMPLFRLGRIIASGNVSPFEPNAHLIYVDVLIAKEVTSVHGAEMFGKGCHTPEWVILLLLF